MRIKFYSLCSVGQGQSEDTRLSWPLDPSGVGILLILGRVSTVMDGENQKLQVSWGLARFMGSSCSSPPSLVRLSGTLSRGAKLVVKAGCNVTVKTKHVWSRGLVPPARVAWAVSQSKAKGQLISAHAEPWRPLHSPVAKRVESHVWPLGLLFINRHFGNATWAKTESPGRRGHVF